MFAKEWHRLTLFYQDMFIYSGQWQESQVFHRYIQRDINKSHLLHKAHSAGTVRKGDTGRTYTVHWAQTHLLNPYRKKGRERIQRRRGPSLGSYSNTKEHVQIVYSLQALCSHIYSCRNRQRLLHGRTIHLRYAGTRKQSQRDEGSDNKTNGVWEGGDTRRHMHGVLQPRGINHCREVHNQVLAIGAHSLTHCESSGTIPLSKTNASHT